MSINVMNRLSVDCNCDGNQSEQDMHDIGILASFDPVAVDPACIDLVYAAQDGDSLIGRIESRNGLHTLGQAEKIGLFVRFFYFNQTFFNFSGFEGPKSRDIDPNIITPAVKYRCFCLPKFLSATLSSIAVALATVQSSALQIEIYSAQNSFDI